MTAATTGAIVTAVITLDRSAAGTPINPHIYGQYLEHVEDCVEPGLITEDGLRTDVIAAAQELGVPAVRWPGGCFADTYHWRDGIGPERPVRPNWHWGGGQVESNRFGTHEFLDWCEQVGASPYINVNLGTGSLIEALRWLDYCTGSADTDDVRTRRGNGREDPWRVDYWGIGNETWGSWEAGAMDKDRYADTLANWAEFFHHYDPDAAIVGVGSAEALDPDWDRTVLDRAGAHLDLLSLHVYAATVIGEADRRRAGLVHFPVYVEQRIGAMADLIREHNRQYGRSVGIAVDEWNIRHWRREDHGGYALDRADPRTGSDALCAAGFFHAMIKNSDVVRMANYVFLVNGNGVLDARDGHCRPTTLATMFTAYRELMSGAAVPVVVRSPEVPLAELCSGDPRGPGDSRGAAQQAALASLPSTVPAVDAVACRSADGLRLAMINRSDQPIRVDVSDVHDQADRIAVDQYVVDTRTEELIATRAAVDGLHTLPAWSVSISRIV